jgi:hypothetical protein
MRSNVLVPISESVASGIGSGLTQYIVAGRGSRRAWQGLGLRSARWANPGAAPPRQVGFRRVGCRVDCAPQVVAAGG